MRHQSGYEFAGAAGHRRHTAVFLGRWVECGYDVSLCRHCAERGHEHPPQPFGYAADFIKESGCCAAPAFVLFSSFGVRREQTGDKAECRCADNDEHRAGQPAHTAAQQPADGVEPPDAVDAPVDAADDGQQQQNLFETRHG